jgi:hypothetical protein
MSHDSMVDVPYSLGLFMLPMEKMIIRRKTVRRVNLYAEIIWE